MTFKFVFTRDVAGKDSYQGFPIFKHFNLTAILQQNKKNWYGNILSTEFKTFIQTWFL